MRTVRFYWRIQADWTWWVPLAVLWLLLIVLFKRPLPVGAHRRPEDLYALYEFYLPLLAGLWAAAVPVLERQHGVAEVHLSCPGRPSLRLLQAAAAPAIAWLATAAVGAWVTQTWYVAHSLPAMGAVTAAPALALSGAAVFVSAMARHQLAGIAAVSFWWLLDAAAPGMVTDGLYLFRTANPMPGVSPEVLTRNLLLLGAGLWLAALWLSHRRERWVR